MADCGVRFAFTQLDKVDKLQKLGVHAIGVPENMDLDSEKFVFLPFRKLIGGQFGNAPRPVIRQQDTTVIMYSSGTTGVSKGVVLTHGNFIAMTALFVRFEASHIVIMRRFDANEVVKVIENYRVTHFPVVPPILTTLTTRVMGVCENGLKSLKHVSSGAAPLNRKTTEDFVQALPHGYGMTESTAVGIRSFNNGKYSLIGLLARKMQAKVVDWNSGFYGELWLRGPAIMQGYINNVEVTKMTIDKDGWLRTGDIIAPADLEAILISHPEILDAAVTSATDEVCGEIPVAFVVRRHGSTLTQGAVMDFVANQLVRANSSLTAAAVVVTGLTGANFVQAT
ncbi:hypothetical protein V6N12_038688 [Hibiscus sabdariffa]|uniref:4-coumarate--CoA ligase n=1 Tax=Hibiscus sabdariffa TaxID=183260 RepID=A0ABR2CCK2_9ROSI